MMTVKDRIYNRKSTILIAFDGKILSAVDWARELDVSPKTLYSRLRRNWGYLKTLTVPVRKYERKEVEAND